MGEAVDEIPYLRLLLVRGTESKIGVSKLGHQVLEERRKQNATDNPDILHLLVNAKTDNGQPLPEKDTVSDACTILIEGADAPSTTIAHFIDCITRDMGVQHRIQEEIDSRFLATLDENWMASGSLVQVLPFLGAALKESQRRIPTSALGLKRVVPDGGREIAGEFLPSGTVVSIPTTVVTHDESILREPKRQPPRPLVGRGHLQAHRTLSPVWRESTVMHWT